MENREYLFKIIVVGDAGSGKTSIINKYVHNIFSTEYRSTIGVDFALKHLKWDDMTIIRLQLWDIAGQERFGNMTRVYYQRAAGAIIVYDVSIANDCVLKWKADLDAKLPMVPVMLFANKLDLVSSIDADKLTKFCEVNGFIGWVGTSAKYGKGIDGGISVLVEEMVKNVPPEQHEDVVNLEDTVIISEKRCCI